MCIDIFSPGYCIDVNILIEQIWLSQSKGNGVELDIFEVYDFCITNRLGNKSLDCLWLLFPHDITTKKDKEREIKIDIWMVNPANSKVHEKYEWAFTSEASWVDETHGIVTRQYYGDPPSLSREGSESKSGLSLGGQVVFPDGFIENHIDVLASREICKTIVCLKLNKPLKPGKKGWLRLAVHPQNLDAPQLKKRKIWNKIPEPFIFEHSLSIACPIIVREKFHSTLEDPSEEQSENDRNACSEMLNRIFSEALFKEGTSTRIQDHRIALIAAEGIGIDDSTCTGEAEFMGIIPELEEQGYTTLLWACGSDRYPELDIAHNARNIIERIHLKGPAKLEELHELAPFGKQVVFDKLVSNMLEVNILKLENDYFLSKMPREKPKKLPKDTQKRVDILEDERFTNLRKKYSYCTMKDLLLHALLDFTDLHPFQIDYRIRWVSISAALEQRLKPLLDILGWDDEQEDSQPENDITSS